MKNGDYFRGIFEHRHDNPDSSFIYKELKNKGWGEFGFFDGRWYFLKDAKLDYCFNEPKSGNKITYKEFRDWLLEKQQLNPQYEIY
jgi:hypothetical protein